MVGWKKAEKSRTRTYGPSIREWRRMERIKRKMGAKKQHCCRFKPVRVNHDTFLFLKKKTIKTRTAKDVEKRGIVPENWIFSHQRSPTQQLAHKLTNKQGEIYAVVSVLPFLPRGADSTAGHVVLCWVSTSIQTIELCSQPPRRTT